MRIFAPLTIVALLCAGSAFAQNGAIYAPHIPTATEQGGMVPQTSVQTGSGTTTYNPGPVAMSTAGQVDGGKSTYTAQPVVQIRPNTGHTGYRRDYVPPYQNGGTAYPGYNRYVNGYYPGGTTCGPAYYRYDGSDLPGILVPATSCPIFRYVPPSSVTINGPFSVHQLCAPWILLSLCWTTIYTPGYYPEYGVVGNGAMPPYVHQPTANEPGGRVTDSVALPSARSDDVVACVGNVFRRGFRQQCFRESDGTIGTRWLADASQIEEPLASTMVQTPNGPVDARSYRVSSVFKDVAN